MLEPWMIYLAIILGLLLFGFITWRVWYARNAPTAKARNKLPSQDLIEKSLRTGEPPLHKLRDQLDHEENNPPDLPSTQEQ